MDYQELMKELGARLGLEDFTPNQDGHFGMYIDETLVTFIEQPEHGLMHTVAKICELPDDGDGDPICRVLLAAMAPTAAADAYTFYLATDGKSICMRRTDALSNLTVDGLLEALERYANALTEWRKSIANFHQAMPVIDQELEQQAEENRTFSLGGDGFLQV